MEFRVINLVGVVYQKESHWYLADEDKGEIDLEEELRQMSDGKIQMTAQHAPPDPPIRERWGGGCCMWESSGKCPAGHHERPGYLYSVSGVGTLQGGDDGVWKLCGEVSKDLYLSMLDGHRCRFIVVPSVDPKEASKIFQEADPNNLADLMSRAEQLRSFISAANLAGKKK